MSTTASPSSSISPAKLRANRRNAQKSTGPRTARGKSRACQNALTHGLCAAKDILLEKENPAEFDQLCELLLEDFNPTDSIELAIFQRALSARWKLRRIHAAEAQQDTLDNSKDTRFSHSYRSDPSFAAEVFTGRLAEWENISRYEQRLENAFYKALRELQSWRREKRAALKAGQVDFEDDAEGQGESPEATDEPSTVSAPNPTPPISQNEPTAEKTVTTDAAPETCEAVPAQLAPDELPRRSMRALVNAVQPIRLIHPPG